MTSQAEQLLNLMAFFHIEEQDKQFSAKKINKASVRTIAKPKTVAPRRNEVNEGEFDLAKFQQF